MRLGWPGFRASLLPFWNLLVGLGLAIGFPVFPYFSANERNLLLRQLAHFALSDMPTFERRKPGGVARSGFADRF